MTSSFLSASGDAADAHGAHAHGDLVSDGALPPRSEFARSGVLRNDARAPRPLRASPLAPSAPPSSAPAMPMVVDCAAGSLLSASARPSYAPRPLRGARLSREPHAARVALLARRAERKPARSAARRRLPPLSTGAVILLFACALSLMACSPARAAVDDRECAAAVAAEDAASAAYAGGAASSAAGAAAGAAAPLSPPPEALLGAPAAAPAPLPRAVFVTFGSAPYAAALRRIEREARATGAFAEVHAFTEADIAPEYAAAHADVLRQPRGAGLWLWKPYLVARVLAGLAEGELLLYADAGCEFRASPAPYLELARRHGFLGFRLEAEHTLQRWTKGDVFAAAGLELGLFGIEPQLVGGVFALRKSARIVAFVAHWLRLCEDLQVIGDAPSVAPNHPGFQGGRHDQAILSALFYKLAPGLALADQTWPAERAPVIAASRRRHDCGGGVWGGIGQVVVARSRLSATALGASGEGWAAR
jgi:hypothetical protein